MSLANAHALFLGLVSEPSFKRKIHIQAGDTEDDLLRDASKRVRSHLRTAFRQIGAIFDSEDGRKIRMAKRDHLSIAKSANVDAIEVRFLRQGSFAYDTLVRRAITPPQEIDLDDGVYVPVEFVDGQPVFSSDALFYVVEQALKPLLDEEASWSMKRKATCVRIQLGSEGAHLDLPLFAVEQTEFARVQGNFERKFGDGARKAEHLNKSRLPNRNDSYRMPNESILLAHDEDDWIHSDPKAFQDWLDDWVEDLGPVCRRVAMYTKAWRDKHFDECELSSLAITISTVEALDQLDGTPADNRDDLMVLHALRELRRKLAGGGIFHPISGARLDENIDRAERAQIQAALDDAITCLNTALFHCTNRQVVVRLLRGVFGARFPERLQAVRIDQASQAAPVTKETASKVPHPNIISSTSG